MSANLQLFEQANIALLFQAPPVRIPCHWFWCCPCVYRVTGSVAGPVRILCHCLWLRTFVYCVNVCGMLYCTSIHLFMSVFLHLAADMPIFGQYPAQDDFFLVMCSHCGQVVKPQAFQAHYGECLCPIKGKMAGIVWGIKSSSVFTATRRLQRVGVYRPWLGAGFEIDSLMPGMTLSICPAQMRGDVIGAEQWQCGNGGKMVLFGLP